MRSEPEKLLWLSVTMPRRRALLLVATCVAMPALGRHGKVQHADRELDGWAITPFTLTDQHGHALTEERLRGRWTFVLFGDTSRCAERCDAALSALAGLCKRIERADVMRTTQIIFISLDPRRDTPERLRAYLGGFDTRFVGGTGTPAMLRRVSGEMGLEAAPGQPDYSGSLLLVGPDSTIRAEYPPPFDAARLTSAYLRARHGRY